MDRRSLCREQIWMGSASAEISFLSVWLLENTGNHPSIPYSRRATSYGAARSSKCFLCGTKSRLLQTPILISEANISFLRAGQQHPALELRHRSAFLYFWQGCPANKNSSGSHPHLHGSDRLLLSWLLLGVIPNKSVAGSHPAALPAWGFHSHLQDMFGTSHALELPGCRRGRTLPSPPPSATFQISSICVNKSLPKGNSCHQLLFHDGNREGPRADSLIRGLSRGHSLHRGPYRCTVAAPWKPCPPHRPTGFPSDWPCCLLQSLVLWQFLCPIPSCSCFWWRGQQCRNGRKNVLSTVPHILVFQTLAN